MEIKLRFSCSFPERSCLRLTGLAIPCDIPEKFPYLIIKQTDKKIDPIPQLRVTVRLRPMKIKCITTALRIGGRSYSMQ